LNPQVTNLLGLARALVTNLGYLRTRTLKDRQQLLMDDVEVANCTTAEPPTPGSEKLEQLRALAGCFAITSVYVLILFFYATCVDMIDANLKIELCPIAGQ
jgi:hypothetical protein